MAPSFFGKTENYQTGKNFTLGLPNGFFILDWIL